MRFELWMLAAACGAGVCLGCTEEQFIQPTPVSPDLGTPDLGRSRPDIGPLLRTEQQILDLGPIVVATYGIGEITYENRTDTPLWLFTNIGPCPPLGTNVCVCTLLRDGICEPAPLPPYVSEPDEVSTIFVQFTPVGPGEEPDADLTLAGCNNDPDCSIEFDIRGYGIRSGFSCTEGLDFGPVPVGSEATVTARCTNIGNVDIDVDFITIVPENIFTLTSSVPEVLPPKESFEMTLRFEPQSVMPSAGSVFVEARESGRVIVDPPRITLSGEGVAP